MTKTEVVIALGSNLGNRSGYLNHALTKMKDLGMKVLRHSCLYETSPVGIQNQNNFVNSAVLATTDDSPSTLLKKMKEVESELGRDLIHGVQGGPRKIDLDLIFYGETTQRTPELTLPHPRWKERDFVKIPLRDLALGYSSDLTDSTQKVIGFLNQVPDVPLGVNQDHESISQVFPLPSGDLESFGGATWMMSVINITPDSFADTHRHLTQEGIVNKDSILKYAKRSVENSVRILDVGGQSTRPGSTLISAEEELARVQPMTKLLMERLGPKRPLISIDTFHSSVARSSVLEGVDIVNDISGGTMDPLMLQTVAELEVPFILQHIRGTPQTMLDKENTTYSEDPVKDIGQELQKQAETAMEAGVPGWSIILDPGVGFSKTKEISFQLVKELGRLKGEILKGTCAKMPLLVGLSRKRFLEILIGERTPEARDVASSALMVDCIRNGADILRTHNPEFTRDIIDVADALYRNKKTI